MVPPTYLILFYIILLHLSKTLIAEKALKDEIAKYLKLQNEKSVIFFLN